MNYRHAFHAGNFADVWKHIALVALLEAMARKDKGFLFLDTHAGIGQYTLQDGPATRTQEYVDGIGRLWGEQDAPPLVARYLSLVAARNRGTLERYPGSPSIARSLLRPQDRAILCELHPEDAALLERWAEADRRLQVRREDGYRALKSALPPLEKRGLVMIDPPYERDDYRAVVKAVQDGVKQFATGTYAVWYPIKGREEIDAFHRSWQGSGLRRLLVAELWVMRDDNPMRLNGSGLLIHNPPWQLDDALRDVLPWLATRLEQRPGEAGGSVRWLVPE